MRSALKAVLRSPLRAVLARLVRRTARGPIQQALWLRFRRLDDAADSNSRELLRSLLDIEVGRLTYGAFHIDGIVAPGSRIGAFCSIAPGARIGGPQHPTGFVSTHPFLWLANRGFVERDDTALQGSLTRRVVIEDDVWIGAHAIVMPGIRIGRGAVVGAGAVVTHDVEPYAIVAGVPARPIRPRLDPEQARLLAAIDWPAWSTEKLRAECELFFDVEGFIARHGPAGTDPA